MQGRQNVSNLERKGPHKSMHCKFCKPPGVITPEKSTRPQMETKTKIHLAHEAADLRVFNVYDEPGVPAPPETDACICILEGENPCPKCAPDKNWEPAKKKTCRCPKGAKPHPSMMDGAAPKKKKEKEEDDEFWWEKYSREHDAIAKETWAAYMAQRRKEKKLQKCQKREEQKRISKNTKGVPTWYQKLSCQQMMYIEFLSTAIRLDSDENITDRTYFVLSGIGLYPRPKRKILKKCLRYSHYNSIRFLNQLHLLTRDEDPFREKYVPPSMKFPVILYSWNERLIMNTMCHLEFPALLRELMDRLPPLPRDQILPQIPYPVFPKLRKKKYDSPYEEPIWRERLNWVDKMKIDKLNRCRAYMDTKRVKIPALALVRRPSLIDARPPFLNQIEANERASRRVVKEEERKPVRKHPISTFNSAVDVTAIAGIEASEISTTDKADTEEICVFLRDPLKEPESMEEEEFVPQKEITFILEDPDAVTTQMNRLNTFSEFGEYSADEDIPFKTPPKTESGATIECVCPPPEGTPGPPALHYDAAKRELDIINENLCGFHPFVSSSTQTVCPQGDACETQDNVALQLISAAERLKEFADEGENEKDMEKPGRTNKKRGKCTRRRRRANKRTKQKRLPKKEKKNKKNERTKTAIVEVPIFSKEGVDDEMERGEVHEQEEEEEEEDEEEGQWADATLMEFGYPRKVERDRERLRKRESEISDPDPDSDDEWSTRPPCTPVAVEVEDKTKKRKTCRKRKLRPSKVKKSMNERKRKMSQKKGRGEKKEMELREEKEDYFKKKVTAVKVDRATMTECYPGEYDHLYSEAQGEGKEEKTEPEEVSLFLGDVESLLTDILKDLADEGYISASYLNIHKHPDIDQLILHLKGEIVKKEKRETLHSITKSRWAKMKGVTKFQISDLGISTKTMLKATWNDKKWISRLAKAKTDEFYFKVANSRAEFGNSLYNTLYQSYFGTDRFLKIYYAYMTSKYEDAILRGIW